MSSVAPQAQVTKKTFYRLPKDLEIREKWIQFLQKIGKQIRENVFYFICENHFLPSDVKEGSTRKLLKPGTVPSILNPAQVKSNEFFLVFLLSLVFFSRIPPRMSLTIMRSSLVSTIHSSLPWTEESSI